MDGVGEKNLIQLELSADVVKQYTTLLGSPGNRLLSEFGALREKLHKEGYVLPGIALRSEDALKPKEFVFYWGTETYRSSLAQTTPVKLAEELLRTYLSAARKHAVDGTLQLSVVLTAALRALREGNLTEAGDQCALLYFFAGRVPDLGGLYQQAYALLNAALARVQGFDLPGAVLLLQRCLWLYDQKPECFPQNQLPLMLLFIGNLALSLNDGKLALDAFQRCHQAAADTKLHGYRNAACCSLLELGLAMGQYGLAQQMLAELAQTGYATVKAQQNALFTLLNCVVELKENPAQAGALVVKYHASLHTITQICNDIRRQETEIGVLVESTMAGFSLQSAPPLALKPFDPEEVQRDFDRRMQATGDLDVLKKQIAASTQAEGAASAPASTAKEDQNYVFISYSHQDYRIVFCDLLELKRAGVRYWYDKNLTAGESWKTNVEGMLRSPLCAGVVFYFSRNSLRSEAVFHEVQYALEGDGSGKPSTHYFMVNLTGEQPSAVIGSLMKAGELTSEKGKLYLQAFADDQTFIPRDANPLSSQHLQGVGGLLRQIREKFNVAD
ncbi:MAG: toll/interleukin-1 receptor domain-containing protein [Candidatus Limiplasma sp.]|nr:toll/interleukin-1 receptor domain-containing protein [Candidatus Limiplasma sp.]